ncbi:uncharacterized protein LOC122658223 [Telopea speciosissima]|uniref:uncharacterized protein LOC122658223 n=1 Tax=Telopea speciosissima TaxID=54955 RepID=UPI001CC5570D|nr:uncharacterized protein LOC122658223 [Telopea speciosissima]
MGSCFSSDTTDGSFSPSTADVISVNGNLREYPTPITVSQVLEIETSPCFLCNSDGLSYDDYIPALDSSEELQPGQIYFVLHTSRLKYRLTAPDMAALAVKATTALAQSSRKKGRRNKKGRISPVSEVKKMRVGNDGYEYGNGVKSTSGDDMSKISVLRSGSIKKLQRNTSKQAKFAIRSFRLRLSTIYEGLVED